MHREKTYNVIREVEAVDKGYGALPQLETEGVDLFSKSGKSARLSSKAEQRKAHLGSDDVHLLGRVELEEEKRKVRNWLREGTRERAYPVLEEVAGVLLDTPDTIKGADLLEGSDDSI